MTVLAVDCPSGYDGVFVWPRMAMMFIIESAQSSGEPAVLIDPLMISAQSSARLGPHATATDVRKASMATRFVIRPLLRPPSWSQGDQ